MFLKSIHSKLCQYAAEMHTLKGFQVEYTDRPYCQWIIEGVMCTNGGMYGGEMYNECMYHGKIKDQLDGN